MMQMRSNRKSIEQIDMIVRWKADEFFNNKITAGAFLNNTIKKSWLLIISKQGLVYQKCEPLEIMWSLSAICKLSEMLYNVISNKIMS